MTDEQESTHQPPETPTGASDAGRPVRLCAVSDLEVGAALRVDVAGERIAVVRLEEQVFRAIGDECSHADYSLAEGDVDLDDCTLECWKHGSVFSLETGEPETLPATQPVTVYDVFVGGPDGASDGESEVWVRLPGNDEQSGGGADAPEEN